MSDLIARTWPGDTPEELDKFCVLCGKRAQFRHASGGEIMPNSSGTGVYVSGTLKCNARVQFWDCPLCAPCLDRKIRELIAELQSGTVGWE